MKVNCMLDVHILYHSMCVAATKVRLCVMRLILFDHIFVMIYYPDVASYPVFYCGEYGSEVCRAAHI